MKQNSSKLIKIVGWALLLFAVGFFCLQMGYLVVHEKYQVTYIDDRLFFIINMLCIICLAIAILLLLTLTKKYKFIVYGVAILFVIVNGVLLIGNSRDMNHILSVSPDWKHVLSIKEDAGSGEATYYRPYYGILARPKEQLPDAAEGAFNVEWLAHDIAAVTYEAADESIQQFIATYGDRGSGRSYYYVGAEIHGQWQADNTEVVSGTEGISVTVDGETETFGWDNMEQFGTLAVVLHKNDEAAWTLSLNENFEVHSDSSEQTVGNIRLYKATMKNNQPITLDYKGSN
ncbi:hypothetical protein [Lentibacillus salicampi]|uniref:Uncharacterized protein n=1 Tax=Lentibacillus salicampi TaxID=175306 RepID=A0A4Y9A900_9BACI|nr:hypothetical protein [Lentibacillus salicampi]TFJ92336.1 hypothetical protein E4U82_12845 [Lentibacillus salicampi]